MRKKVALEKISELEKELQQCNMRLNSMNVQYEKMLNDYKVCYSALEASQNRIKELSEKNEALAAEAEQLRVNNAKLCIAHEESRVAVAEPVVENVAAGEAIPSITDTPEVNVAATQAPKVQREVKLSEIEKIGSAVIGEVVVEATKILGELSGKTTPNAKDTLTLVLGRTEVLKSEVLAVVRADDLSDEEKVAKINDCKDQALEYLASVAAQE